MAVQVVQSCIGYVALSSQSAALSFLSAWLTRNQYSLSRRANCMFRKLCFLPTFAHQFGLFYLFWALKCWMDGRWILNTIRLASWNGVIPFVDKTAYTTIKKIYKYWPWGSKVWINIKNSRADNSAESWCSLFFTLFQSLLYFFVAFHPATAAQPTFHNFQLPCKVTFWCSWPWYLL